VAIQDYSGWLCISQLSISYAALHSIEISENCGYDTFKCEGVDHYEHECPPSWYQHKLTQYVKEDKLPPNHVATISRSPAWVREVCGGMRSNGTSYKQRPGWQRLEASPLKPVGAKPLTPLPYRSLVGGPDGAKKEKKDRRILIGNLTVYVNYL
jgi:hypothetical protein